MRITPTGQTLGATITGLDLAHPLDDAAAAALLGALGAHGVLCFPGQDLAPEALAGFGARFGSLEIHVAGTAQLASVPQVMVLSNMRDAEGRKLGLDDAGQGWHTDMSYSREIALANILHARHVPRRHGRPLGETQFRNMHAAYDDLPEALKTRLAGRTATHDFAKFWDMMRARPGATRPPLTPAQRARKPPVAQPIFRRHPLTGRMVLYANPGYTIAIDGMEQAESDALLDFLFRHQDRADYLHAHRWTEGDVLMWDNIGTTHNAVADYLPDEPRMMWRVQVMADRVLPAEAA